MTEQQSSDSGSFVTGFTIGMFAGALGYFAFGTKKGAVVREQIAREWEKARQHLATETALDGVDVSFGDMANKIKDFVSVVLTGVSNNSNSNAQNKKTTSSAKNKNSANSSSKPKKRKKLFKGV